MKPKALEETFARTTRDLAPRGSAHLEKNECLMTLVEVSELLGVPVATLYGWRHRGEGPVGYRIGRHVRYRRATVEEWIETQADHRASF